MKELIEGLKAQCRESIEFEQEEDYSSWLEQVGVLLTRNEAESLIDFYEQNKWIDAEESPLVTYDEDGNWEKTESGECDFIGAIETNKKWEIGFYCIDDEVGLCVIADDYRDGYTSWDIDDIEYYKIIRPPK